MKVIVYGTENCSWCKKAREFLKKHKVKFIEKDIGSDTIAREEMVKKSGQQGVPVIDVEGFVITGFDEEKLKKILGIR